MPGKPSLPALHWCSCRTPAVHAGHAIFIWEEEAAAYSRRASRVGAQSAPEQPWASAAVRAAFNVDGRPTRDYKSTAAVQDTATLLPSKIKELGEQHDDCVGSKRRAEPSIDFVQHFQVTGHRTASPLRWYYLAAASSSSNMQHTDDCSRQAGALQGATNCAQNPS